MYACWNTFGIPCVEIGMEENLQDSSKLKISLQSLDSRFADQRSCENASFQLTMPHKLKNVMRIRLASIELPNVEYQFSKQQGNLQMAVRVGASTVFTKTAPIEEGNYVAQDLVALIQTKLQLIHSGFLCTMNTVNGKVTITNTSVAFEMYFLSLNPNIARRPAFNGLGQYLGFRCGRQQAVKDDCTGYQNVVSSSVINIDPTQQYLLQLSCPEPVVNVTHRVSEDGFVDAFAKIILKDGQFQVAFDDNSNLLRKEFTFLAPVSIPQFKVTLLNSFGEEVNMHNVDWSVTLEITEVVNSRTYGQISRTQDRP